MSKKKTLIPILIGSHLLCVLLGYCLRNSLVNAEEVQPTTIPTGIIVEENIEQSLPATTDTIEQTVAAKETEITVEETAETTVPTEVAEEQKKPTYTPAVTTPPTIQPSSTEPPATQPPATQLPAVENETPIG